VQIYIKKFYLFSKYRFHNFVNRQMNGTNGPIEKNYAPSHTVALQKICQLHSVEWFTVFSFMPPPVSLTWRRHKEHSEPFKWIYYCAWSLFLTDIFSAAVATHLGSIFTHVQVTIAAPDNISAIVADAYNCIPLTCTDLLVLVQASIVCVWMGP